MRCHSDNFKSSIKDNSEDSSSRLREFSLIVSIIHIFQQILSKNGKQLKKKTKICFLGVIFFSFFSARQILGGMNSQNLSDKRVQSQTTVPTSSSSNCHHFPSDCSGFWPFGHQLMPPFYTAGIPTMFPPPSPIPVPMPFYYPGAMPQFDGNMRVLQHSSNNTGCARGSGTGTNNSSAGNNLMIQFSHQTVNQNGVGVPIEDTINESIVLKGLYLFTFSLNLFFLSM